MTEFQDKLDEVKEQEARSNFANYTQSVAFNMTLSRSMVEALGLIRDTGGIYLRGTKNRKATVNIYSVPIANSLIRRGLVIHHCVNDAERYQFLTKAGALMCELLVEAGLLQPAQQEKKKAANV